MNAQHWVGGETESQRGEEPARSPQQAGSGAGDSGAFSGGLSRDLSTIRWHAVAEQGSSPSWRQEVCGHLRTTVHTAQTPPLGSLKLETAQVGSQGSGASGSLQCRTQSSGGPSVTQAAVRQPTTGSGDEGTRSTGPRAETRPGHAHPRALLPTPPQLCPVSPPHFCCPRGLAVATPTPAPALRPPLSVHVDRGVHRHLQGAVSASVGLQDA